MVDVESTGDRSVLYVMTLSGDLWKYDTATHTAIGGPLATGIVEPWALDLSRDGTRLAFTGGEGAGVVDTVTGQVVVEGVGGEPGGPALSPDGSRLALGLQGNLTIFDTATGSVQYELDEPDASMAFLSDTRLAVQGLGQQFLNVYALAADGAATVEVTKEGLPPGGGMKLSPDGTTMITGGLQGTAVLLDGTTLEPRAPVIRVRGSRTGDFAFNPDGTFVALGSDDGSVLVVDVATGAEVASLTGLTGVMVSEFIGADELVSSSASNAGSTMWSLTSRGTGLSTTQQTQSNVVALRTIADGQAIVAVEGSDVIVAPRDDVVHPTVRRTFGTLIRAIDVAESAGLVAVYVINYDLETGAVLGRDVHVVGLDDLDDRTVIAMDDAVENVSFNPDATLLAIGRRDGRLQVNDVTSGATVVEPFDVDEFPCCLATLVWSRDGSRLHTGGQDGFLRTFDSVTWERLAERQLTVGQNALRLSQLTDDGSTIVVPAESGEIFLIDEATGEPIGEPFISAGTQIQRAVLVRGGSMLAAQGRDGRLRLWDVATHRLVGRPLIGHVDYAPSVERVSDDVVVTGGANDGLVIEWSLDPQVWIERACALAGRNLTHDEWDVYIGGEYETTCDQWPAGA